RGHPFRCPAAQAGLTQLDHVPVFRAVGMVKWSSFLRSISIRFIASYSAPPCRAIFSNSRFVGDYRSELEAKLAPALAMRLLPAGELVRKGVVLTFYRIAS